MTGGLLPTLAAVRTHALSKVSAIFFVAVILLPFTAPFPTFDLAGATTTHTFDCSDKVKTAADDLAVMVQLAWEPSRRLLAAETAPVIADRVAPLVRPQRAILRL